LEKTKNDKPVLFSLVVKRDRPGCSGWLMFEEETL